VSDNELIDDLKAARAELSSRGRQRGALIGHHGQVCLLGAIGAATLEGFVDLATYNPCEAMSDLVSQERPQAVVQALLPYLDAPPWDGGTYGHCDPTEWVWAFNDDRKTTDEDVLALFDKALANLGGL
jgi:hypothetical protein